MTIYYLYGANQGKDFALAEIKNKGLKKFSQIIKETRIIFVASIESIDNGTRGF